MKTDAGDSKIIVNKLRSMSLELLTISNTIEELGDFRYIKKIAKESPTITAILRDSVINFIDAKFDKCLSACRSFVEEEVELSDGSEIKQPTSLQ
jgi:hypothetical protein